MLTASGGLYQLTPYEGMRVTVPSMTSVSGTNGSITSANEPTETATSTGYFYAVITGTARPFREPGIDIRDVAIPGAPSGIAQFDDNPERILVDSTIAGGTSIEISTGAVLPNVTGVLDFTFSNDSFYDPSRLILDTTYDRTQVVAGMTVQPVPKPAATEFTVASFNIERFYNTSSTDDLYYVPAGVNGFNGSSSTPILSTGQTFISEAVDVTQAAYTRRLQKVSLAIRTVLNMPDIVTLEEVENQSVANDIANQINTDAGVPNLYTAYSTDNTTYYSQDGTGISVGFLVKNSTVNKLNVTQFGQKESFTPTSSTNPITLNDRPWLVLNAGIKRANAKDYPVTVIVNHMKALTGVNSTTSTSTRQKKELQAEDVAKYIQTLQAAGQHVISGGDFNAFEFSDGYTDTLATYTNTNVLPATQVVQPGVAGLVTPPLTDLALLLPANQRWSYSEDGSAQILDHIVVTPELAAAGAHMAYAHLDADFPVTAYNDATTAARTSDHDAAVGYFTLPAPTLAATLTPTTATFPGTVIGKPSTGQVFIVTNTGEGPVTVTSISSIGPFAFGEGGPAASNACAGPLAIGATCAINVVFTPTAAGTATGQLRVVTSASATGLFSALTGTGLAPDFTLADGNGKTSTSTTLIAGTTGAVTLVVTPVNTFTGTVTLTCTATGTAPTGVTCTPPAAFAVTTGAVTQNVTFTTTSRTTTSGLSLITGNRSRRITALILAMAGLLMLFASRTRSIGRLTVRGAGLFALLLAICIPPTGCSSGPSTNPQGTPAGTYNYTVTATSGAIVHTEAVTLSRQLTKDPGWRTHSTPALTRSSLSPQFPLQLQLQLILPFWLSSPKGICFYLCTCTCSHPSQNCHPSPRAEDLIRHRRREQTKRLFIILLNLYPSGPRPQRPILHTHRKRSHHRSPSPNQLRHVVPCSIVRPDISTTIDRDRGGTCRNIPARTRNNTSAVVQPCHPKSPGSKVSRTVQEIIGRPCPDAPRTVQRHRKRKACIAQLAGQRRRGYRNTRRPPCRRARGAIRCCLS